MPLPAPALPSSLALTTFMGRCCISLPSTDLVSSCCPLIAAYLTTVNVYGFFGLLPVNFLARASLTVILVPLEMPSDAGYSMDCSSGLWFCTPGYC